VKPSAVDFTRAECRWRPCEWGGADEGPHPGDELVVSTADYSIATRLRKARDQGRHVVRKTRGDTAITHHEVLREEDGAFILRRVGRGPSEWYSRGREA